MAINPADITTIRVGELASALPNLTDNIPHEIGTDLFRCTIQELVSLVLLNASAFQYEIKTLSVDQTYIDTNFDETGLGRLICLGWAIVNGQNGTVSEDGLVSLAYGSSYDAVGAFGGFKDSIVVDHFHNVSFTELPNGASGSPGYDGGNNRYLENATIQTASTGVSGLNRNMQPYIVQLKMMKL